MPVSGSSKTVLHVLPTFGNGGRERRTVELLRAMPEWRHVLAVLDGCFDALYDGEEVHATETVSLAAQRTTFRRAARLRALMRQLAPNLIITYNWGAVDGIITAVIAGYGPLVHIEDGFGADESTRLKSRRSLARRVLLKCVAATIVPSNSLFNTCRDVYRVPETRLHFIPNGIDTEKFDYGQAPALREALRIPVDAVVIGSVGRLRPEKDIHTLIKRFATASVQTAYLVVVGEGDCGAELKELARKAGVWDRVRFAGARSDVADFYKCFDIFAMSSRTEQMPLALLEAMASHLPAVCTRVGDTAEMMSEQNRSFVYRIDDESGYVSGLRALIQNQKLRCHIGSSNRVVVLSKFSQDQMVSAHRSLYETVMSEPVR